MIPILYSTVTEGSVPSNFGIGALSDAIRAEVIEQRNGSFELSMTYTANGIHAEDIQPNRIIKAKPNFTDNPQLFRIYKVGKTINGQFEVNAQHISYDLSGKVIGSGSAGSCVAACSVLQAKADNFTITTDISSAHSFTISEPSSVRSWFGGKAGAFDEPCARRPSFPRLSRQHFGQVFQCRAVQRQRRYRNARLRGYPPRSA